MLMGQMEEHNKRFTALTHEVFKNNPKGAEWLEMITESLLLVQPTCDPSRDARWDDFREGMNTFVRNIRQTIKINEMKAKQEIAK